jgi:hypothetical protein
LKTAESARDTIRSFREYIETHKAEIDALQILYSRPFHKRITEEALRDFEAKLKPEFGPTPVEKLWTAFEKSGTAGSPGALRSQTRRFTDLVSLVRVALEQEPVLQPFEEHVRNRFSEWIEAKRREAITFTGDQMTWLERMRDYIIASGSVEREHLEADNVLGPVYHAFGERLWPLMDELNLALAALTVILRKISSSRHDGVGKLSKIFRWRELQFFTAFFSPDLKLLKVFPTYVLLRLKRTSLTFLRYDGRLQQSPLDTSGLLLSRTT